MNTNSRLRPFARLEAIEARHPALSLALSLAVALFALVASYGLFRGGHPIQGTVDLLFGVCILGAVVYDKPTASPNVGADPRNLAFLSSYPDPFIVKDGAVWVLRHTGKDLCSAPLIAEQFAGEQLAFYPEELAEAYPTDLLPQAEIDAIIVALTPAPVEA